MSTYIGDVWMPWPMLRVSGYPGVDATAATVDADTEKVACVFQVPRTGSIEYVGFGFGVIGTTPGANVDIRLETVNTVTGDPTGTLFDTNTNYSWDMSGASTHTIHKIGPLTSNASVTRGDYVAVVYVPPASPDQGDVDFIGSTDETYGFPYSKFYNGASWVATNNRVKAILYYTDGFAYMPAHFGAVNNLNYAVNSGDTYNHVGVQMTPNVDLLVSGMWVHCDLDTDSKLKIISGSDTLIGGESIQLESDYRVSTTYSFHCGYYSSPVTLTADTSYRFVIAPDTTTDITLVCPRPYDSGDTSNPTHVDSYFNNPLSSVKMQEGELTTPTWQNVGGTGANAWPLIGPIVRAIG